MRSLFRYTGFKQFQCTFKSINCTVDVFLSHWSRKDIHPAAAGKNALVEQFQMQKLRKVSGLFSAPDYITAVDYFFVSPVHSNHRTDACDLSFNSVTVNAPEKPFRMRSPILFSRVTAVIIQFKRY